MANKLTDDILGLTIEVNGNELQKELGELESTNKSLTRSNKELRIEKQKLEAQNKKETKEYKAVTDAIKKNNLEIKQNKQRMKELRGEIGLTGLTANQLKKRAKELTAQLNRMTKSANPREFARLEKELNATNKQLDKVKVGGKKAHGSFSALKTLLPTLGVGAFIGLIVRAGKALFDLNAQMEQNARKARLVLGPAYSEVTELAKEHAKSVGLTNLQYRDVVTNVADLLVPLDFTRRQSALMASEVINLAGAFSEWSGGMYNAQEVAEDLNKGILGEMETLKKYGIAIRKDSEEWKNLVKQKLEDGAATLAQAEALTAYELILKKSADAQTSFNQEGAKLLRKKKDFTTFWNSVKEGAVEMFDIIGKQAVYMSDNFDLLINRMQKRFNDFVKAIGLKEVFDVEPLVSFSNAILESDQRFIPFIKKIEEIGIHTKEGKKEWLKLAQALQNAYGEEGIQVATEYYTTQKKLIKQQQEAWEAEEMAVIESNKRKLEAREKQEVDALQRTYDKLAAIDQERLNEMIEKGNKAILDADKEIKDVTFESLQKEFEKELAALEEFEQERMALRQQYKLIDHEEMRAIEMELLEQAREQDLLTKTEYEKAQFAVEEKYRVQKLKADKDAADEEKRIQMEKYQALAEYTSNYGNTILSITGSLSNLYEAQKQRELQAAGDNAEKKEQIERKYAKKQQKIALIQAIVNTAMGVTQALGSSPPPLSFILAALVAAAGAIEIATISSQQYAKGKYSVLGAEDGKRYNANYIGKPKTGIVSGPALISEAGDELIVDNPTLEKTMIHTPWAIDAIMANRTSVPQFASGNYTAVPSSVSAPDMSRMESLLEQNIAVNTRLTEVIENPPPSNAVFGPKAVQDIRNEINKQETIESNASRAN